MYGGIIVKRFICILMTAMFLLSGCTKGDGTISEITNTDSDNGEISVKGTTEIGTYSENDFALFTLDEEYYPHKTVCMVGIEPEKLIIDDETAILASEGIERQAKEYPVTDENGRITNKRLMSYFSYSGTRVPLANSKGIFTTGKKLKDTDENCSHADDVIKAYDIDINDEEYIAKSSSENEYIIELYFTAPSVDGGIQRIYTPKGDNLEEQQKNARYAIRFYIYNDYVHGMDYYMF